MEKINEKIIQKIKILMNSRDMTQGDLARKIGKSSSVISNWFAGRNHPSIGDIEKIESALGEKIIFFDDKAHTESSNYEELNEKIENLNFTLTTFLRNISQMIENNSTMIKNNMDFSNIIATVIVGKINPGDLEKCRNIAETTNNETLKQFIDNNLSYKP